MSTTPTPPIVLVCHTVREMPVPLVASSRKPCIVCDTELWVALRQIVAPEGLPPICVDCALAFMEAKEV